MHILDMGEDHIAKFLKATGITREQLEAERKQDEAHEERNPPDPSEFPPGSYEKMTEHMVFEVQGETEQQDEPPRSTAQPTPPTGRR